MALAVWRSGADDHHSGKEADQCGTRQGTALFLSAVRSHGRYIDVWLHRRAEADDRRQRAGDLCDRPVRRGSHRLCLVEGEDQQACAHRQYDRLRWRSDRCRFRREAPGHRWQRAGVLDDADLQHPARRGAALPRTALGAGQCAWIRLLRAALPATDVARDTEPAGDPRACRLRVDDIGNRLSTVHDRRPLYSLERGRVDRFARRRARPTLGLARLLRDADAFHDHRRRDHPDFGLLVSVERHGPVTAASPARRR